MTIAITGATGFVGQAVMEQAVAAGLAVRALTRRDQSDRDGVTWVRGDLADRAALAELVRGAEVALHIAGVVNTPDPIGFHLGNVEGTRALIDAAGAAGCKRLIFVSSLAAREPDLSAYGRSKHDAERDVKASALDWTIVRPPAIYGPRDREMLELFRAARWGVVPMPPHGHASVIHVGDLARLLLSLATGQGGSGQVFEPDDGRPGGWSHGDLARAIGEAVGRRVWVPRMPKAALRMAARLDGAVRGKGAKLTLDRVGYMTHPDWVCSPARAVPAQLWAPAKETRAGLAETARWYREAGWL